MPVNTKSIKRRIKSVGNTRKITKAMEMVAASKMRRAVEAVLGTRPYSQVAWNILVNIVGKLKHKHKLLEVRPVEKMLIVLVTSNRGLCGGLNSNILKKLMENLKKPQILAKQRSGEKFVDPPRPKDLQIDFLTIGKKGEAFVRKLGKKIIASFIDIPDTPNLVNVLPIAKMIRQTYERGDYDKILVVYSDFKSTISQHPKLRQLLPISSVDLEKMILEAGSDENSTRGKLGREDKVAEYLFEPSKDTVIDIILPRLLEVQIFQSLLESSASEHSARMMAMRTASDAARDMIKELTLTYNQARQSGITQELAEIVGGAAALN